MKVIVFGCCSFRIKRCKYNGTLIKPDEWCMNLNTHKTYGSLSPNIITKGTMAPRLARKQHVIDIFAKEEQPSERWQNDLYAFAKDLLRQKKLS